MKRLYTILYTILFLASPSWASPPTRQFTYTPGSVITASENLANEDAIFNYLQAGIDTYSPLSLENADISASANIQSDKLNLTSIAQNVGITSGGSFDNNGTTNLDGALTVTTSASFSGATISNLGTVTTGVVTAIRINAGSIDASIGDVTAKPGRFTSLRGSTFNLGTTNQGDVLYDNGTSITRLVPGTSGYFLKTQGAGANPIWAQNQQYFELISTTSGVTFSGDPTSSITIEASKTYFVEFELDETGPNNPDVGLQFNGDTGSSYGYARTTLNFNTTEAEVHESDDSHTSILLGTMGAEIESGLMRGHFYIDTTAYETAFTAFVWGQYINHNASEFLRTEIAGTWQTSTAPTSFALDTVGGGAGTINYIIRLYEIRH